MLIQINRESWLPGSGAKKYGRVYTAGYKLAELVEF